MTMASVGIQALTLPALTMWLGVELGETQAAALQPEFEKWQQSFVRLFQKVEQVLSSDDRLDLRTLHVALGGDQQRFNFLLLTHVGFDPNPPAESHES
jgi:hypothetical protein